MLNRQIYQGIQLALIASNFLFAAPVFAAGENASLTPEAEVQNFADTITLIKNYYVKPVKNHGLFNDAIQGMLIGLDPYSGVIDKQAAVALENIAENIPAETGLEVTIDKGVLKVITARLDTPAFKAGINPGDYIIKLDKKSTQGLTLENAVQLLRGNEGSSIQLSVLRKGETKPLIFTVKRQKISTASIKSKLYNNQFAYIRVSQFQQNTAKDLNTAISQLQKQAGGTLKGLILDLRYNPGGVLESAIEVADAFIDNKSMSNKMLIVHTEGRIPGLKYTALATPGDILDKAPIVVLINNGSASAAEVVAGALKDNHRAITIGVKSFGKGSVQTVIPLDEKSSLKLTTGFYFTPKGQAIQDKGITPDISVEALTIPGSHQANGERKQDEADFKSQFANKKNALELAQEQNAQITDKLLHEDYQLYTALTILKGAITNH